MKAVRKRIMDELFLNLLWRFIKPGHVEHGMFRAASEGLPLFHYCLEKRIDLSHVIVDCKVTF